MDGLNAGYAALLLEQYLENPSAVPSEWRTLFENAPEELLAVEPGLARIVEQLVEQRAGNGNGHAQPVTEPVVHVEVDDALAPAIASAMRLVNAYRSHGHLAARLDPLGSEPTGDPQLEPEHFNLTPDLLARIPACILGLYGGAETLADALPTLQATYCGSIAYEIEHISDHEERTGCARRSSPAATGSRSTRRGR